MYSIMVHDPAGLASMEWIVSFGLNRIYVEERLRERKEKEKEVIFLQNGQYDDA